MSISRASDNVTVVTSTRGAPVTRIDANTIRTQVAALMVEFPELAHDEELRICTLDCETELFEALAALLDDIRAADALQQAIESRVGDLRARKERFARREEACRRGAMQLMEAADLRTAALAEATLSLRPTPRSVRLINPELLPAEFFRVKREPDLSAIKAALKVGTAVPGAALSNAADTLTILSR